LVEQIYKLHLFYYQCFTNIFFDSCKDDILAKPPKKTLGRWLQLYSLPKGRSYGASWFYF